MNEVTKDLKHIDRPVNLGNPQLGWASDVAAEMLRRLGIKYISLNPGASYRGLHDSIVNYLGNEDPQMLICLHEDHAVHVAQGYAKATGEPMACALHSNVGLMHGLMATFNAWCNRAPIIMMGATGPVDAPLRRPWIDWIHTAKDQGALLRNYNPRFKLTAYLAVISRTAVHRFLRRQKAKVHQFTRTKLHVSRNADEDGKAALLCVAHAPDPQGRVKQLNARPHLRDLCLTHRPVEPATSDLHLHALRGFNPDRLTDVAEDVVHFGAGDGQDGFTAGHRSALQFEYLADAPVDGGFELHRAEG